MNFTSIKLLHEFSTTLKKHKQLLLAIATGILTIQGGHLYAATNSASAANSSFFVSIETAVFFFIGVVISFFYIKGMAGVLNNAVKTYNTAPETSQDTYANGLVKTILAVITSAIVIASYGLGAYFLYLGPVLCLLSPIGIIYFMYLDIHNSEQI
jgi:Na+-transporting methylmalonyl-CoA/oxaloacetate decarboxylase gamma subunit